MGADSPEGPRTAAEREALPAGTYYASVHDLATPPERAYLSALADARSVVLRRLLRGLLRGHPEGLPDPAVVSASTPRLPNDPVFSGVEVDALLDGPKHRDQDLDPAEAVAVLPFPASVSVVVAPVVGVHGYDRLRLADPVVRWTSGTTARIDHPVALVPLLREEGAFSEAGQADRIRAELAESTANLALARLAERVQANRSRAVDSLLASVLGPAGDRPLVAADDPSALERVVTEGHPFHPAGKIRRGMSPTDGLAYAPEFTGTLDLRFVAVRADRTLRVTADERYLTERLSDAFDGLDRAVSRVLPDGRDWEEYVVIPVHPWQYHHVVPDRYAPEIADGTVRPVDGYTHPATPLLNLRTVVPDPTGGTDVPPHCKLAIGVQTTNVERTLSPQAVTNGPRVTRLFRAVAAEASLERLGVLAEQAAACYYPPGGPHLGGDVYDDVRHLSGLVRQNPRSHRLVEPETPVPASSLVAVSPASGEPLVREAVERFADATDTTALDEAAAAFVREYVDAVVPDQLRLLSKYGIALESHLQNSYVVLTADARPVATLVRDLGGIRVHHERLADHGFAVDTYPDSDLDADGERDLYRKLYYALFQNHLAELLVALVASTPVREADCWDVVRERCRAAFDAVRADGAVPAARVDRDEAALFEAPAVHKALTAMRLRGKRHEYVTSPVANPLASPQAVERVDRLHLAGDD